MGLTFPLNPSQAGNHVAQNNLSVLLCAKNTREDVTSEVVRNAFKDYQDAKMGFGHYVKKFTVSLAAYGATIGVPVAAVIGTTYWFLKDYIKAEYITNPLLAAKDIGKLVLNNQPAIDPNNPYIGGLAPLTTPAFLFGTAAAVAVVDKAFKDKFGIAPARSVAKWSANMMSTVLLYAAYKAGELAGASYLQEENEKTDARKYAHQKIIEQLKCIYEHVADGFFKEYEKGKDNPKEMIRFKHMAEQLEENFPYIKSKLEDLDLKPFEIDLIMSKLSMTVATIKDSALEFRQGGTDDNHRFNIELLKTLSMKDMSSVAIPNDVKNHLKIAEYNQLGTMHAIKSLATASAAGLATTVVADLGATAVMTLAAQGAGLDVGRNFQTGTAILALVPSLNEGTKVYKKVYNNFLDEKAKANLRKEEQVVIAHEKLFNIYNGIARYLTKQYNSSKHNTAAMQALGEEARNILAKLPLIEAEIARFNCMCNYHDITQNLSQILVKLGSVGNYDFSFPFQNFN